MFWANMREEEFEEAIAKTEGLCVIPIGCFEMHGQHLPVATDCMVVEKIAELAAEMEPMCIFPTFRFGDIPELVNWKGTVRLEPKLMMQLLENLCSEISRNGFKKILILNGHGGNNPFLDFFLRSMQYKKKDYLLMARDSFRDAGIESMWAAIKENGSGYYPELLPEDEETLRNYVENGGFGGHADLLETSNLMAVYPELVRLDRMSAVSGLSSGKADRLTGAGMFWYSMWAMNFQNSYCGTDPVGASARIGKTLLRLNAEGVARACKVFKEEADSVWEWENHRNAYYPD